MQTTHGPSQGSGASPRSYQLGPCFNCLEIGHLKANCPKLTGQYPLNNISVDKSINIVYINTQGIQNKDVYFPLVSGNSDHVDNNCVFPPVWSNSEHDNSNCMFPPV